jgi:two-component system sensor histidine kinase SenX3
MVATVDTTVTIVGGIAVAAAAVATVFIVSLKRLSRSVDHALDRIGASPARRWWRRASTLRREIRSLEERTTESHRDRARLAAAVKEAPTGILITDDQGVVFFANSRASRFLGARHGEAVAEARMRQSIETAILSRKPTRTELEIYTPQHRFLEIGTLPLELGVESLGAVTYIRDVTQDRRVDAMRSDFVANVSHELKTPLGALVVLAETLEEHASDPAVAARMADRVGKEARRLSDLIGDILDLSEAEAVDRPRAPVELASVMVDVVEDLGPEAAEKGVDLHIQTFSPKAVVWGERRQLRTLLTNVIENAVKYSPAGDADRRPRVSVMAKTSKKEIVVSVEDEGIGIREQHLDRIFERFYRVDKGRDRETGGTGLGLSIARHIARNHGGDISVESQLGVGSTFRIRLPLWREP